MYYESAENTPAALAGKPVGLPMTPSVALRALYDQVETYLQRSKVAPGFDLYMHFNGPIEPPRPGLVRPLGDAVSDTIASYASKIIGRSGLLSSHSTAEHHRHLEEHGRLTREMFAAEHALAIDLSRTHSEMPLRERENAARFTLALAAYWCDRRELEGIGLTIAHPLIGLRPQDAIGGVLYDFAMAASNSPLPASGPSNIVDLRPQDLTKVSEFTASSRD